MFDPNYNGLPAGSHQTFVSRPDLTPPLLNVNGSGTPGYVFFNHVGHDVHQPALIIADHNGDIVYVNNTIPFGSNFDAQNFDGQQFLTFWSGTSHFSYGFGNYYLMDNTLNIAEIITAAASAGFDLHEFNIVNDTALVTFYYPLAMNLTKWGGPANGYVYGSGFQQIDLKSRDILFEWRCTDHVGPDSSFAPLGKTFGDGTTMDSEGFGPWDYFHINSVDIHPTDGSFLVSGRLTSSLYKIAKNGTIIWTMTGYRGKVLEFGDFYIGERANFEWQHHAVWLSDTEISIFDNAVLSHTSYETTSRGLRIAVNTSTPGAYTTSLIQELIDWTNPLSNAQGSLQHLSNGNYWLSYGSEPLFVEFSSTGQVISQYQTSPAGSDVRSYRAFKKNFTSNPTTNPDIALKDSIVYMSWNGATEVKQWRILSGASPTNLSIVGTVFKTGFETNFTFHAPYDPNVNFTRADALDVNRKVLRSSRTIRGHLSPIPGDREDQVVMGKTTFNH